VSDVAFLCIAAVFSALKMDSFGLLLDQSVLLFV